MAGAGAKLFVDGTILDAVGINTYLMDQAVMRFADATARTAAFGGACSTNRAACSACWGSTLHCVSS